MYLQILLCQKRQSVATTDFITMPNMKCLGHYKAGAGEVVIASSSGALAPGSSPA